MREPQSSFVKPRPLPVMLPRATRRDFIHSLAAASLYAALAPMRPAWAQHTHGTENRGNVGQRSGGPDTKRVDLVIDRTSLRIGDGVGTAVTVNGSLPAPLLRFREGEEVELHVTNRLSERASIHWHGILLPNAMDGVPGVTFKGIDPGDTFVYRFPLRQYGTYWYHSHSGMQEQLGLYGPIVIDPVADEPFAYDREHVVVLSDWTFSDPHRLLAKLKMQSNFSNLQRQTLVELVGDAREKGVRRTFSEWAKWAGMRMDPTDIADLTGANFTFLVNGRASLDPWTGIFKPGERVRLRFINSAATTHFDVRISGLKMTVVQADGQHVEPVTVEEFRMGAAETYDVLVEPTEERAYAIFAETTDRSGFALASLAPRDGMRPELPPRRKRPLRTMADMGMGNMEEHSSHQQPGGAAHGEHGSGMDQMAEADHAKHGASGHGSSHEAKPASESMSDSGGHGGMEMPQNEFGPGNSMMAMMPMNRAGEPGTGLGEDGRRVLVYRDLVALDHRKMPEVQREIVLNATGNMERFIWGFDGKKYSESEPVRLKLGERVRVTFVNQTMMDHPLHLHGMFMELEHGGDGMPPLKHTVVVKPGEKISVLVTADAPGDWAFHCHLQYHMEAGMFRVFSVT